MGGKKKLPKHKKGRSKIPSNALEVDDNVNYAKLKPVFKFADADPNRWTLDKWNPIEIKDLVKTFKQMEQLSWNEIRRYPGFEMKKIKDLSPPRYLSPDTTIQEIRICQVKRMFGYVDKNIFNIVWFDRDHSVCPEGKNRKHG